MGLADYTPASHKFDLKGASFTVEGLTLESFGQLVRAHLPDMEELFSITGNVLSGKSTVEEGDLEQIAIALSEKLPYLVANIIAHASGDNSDAAVNGAQRLPAPLQVQALLKIAELTFDEVGGIKKFIEGISPMLRTYKEQVPSLTKKKAK